MVVPIPHTLLHYTEADVDLFGQWLNSLTDMIAQAAIAARLVRLELGLFGDCKGLEGGLFELRIDHGQGWRVYYGIESGRVVLLLAGSDKSGQKSAIKTARKRLKNWKKRNIQ
ncbi:MAG: type II toxin-antitoxin system RelE/ParE family toxin [Rhodoferax sp.]|nr:type II toxin-antitoxin system RelE/ParE family toxin [Rhodoferax sp.]